MKNEKKKEILTQENCKLDLLMRLTPPFAWIITAILLLFLVGVIAVFLFYAPLPWAIIGVSTFGLIFVAIAVAFPIEEYRRRKKNRKIREGKFHIEEEVLAGIVKDVRYYRPVKNDNGRRDRLDFADRRSFFLDVETGRRPGMFTYYKWSSLYYMTSAGILNTTQLGDRFYLLVYDDDPERKPIMVYNAKFFEYDEYKFYEES